ncbi:ubiquitin-like protein Pup [Ornithinimicrobium pratense]|uniref:Prokaryotic ubiquitin-like protein Pup n=1 Tax=Ornithinimicrobium pratense TaxID=2593973 RepID=A0A5J6V6J4_9MICO|nr:ubiquitin-like protein Pup [Ornithinimicrobium pratense]QFG68663.1 ubiquitin-like protein Pup [Ornithinimicrobium pratense]
MSQQQFDRRRDDAGGEAPEPEAPPAAPAAQTQERDAALDSLLDEIDGVLEKNASEFVHGFVQKGGQ